MKEFIKKFKSIKVLVTIWCMVLLSHIVFHKMTDFMQLAIILASAPLVYCGVNVLQDKIYKEENNNNESKVQ